MSSASLIGWYPFSREYRAQASTGYLQRSADYPFIDQETGAVDFIRVDDQIPYVSAGLVGDTMKYNSYGPHAGSAWELNTYYGFDTEESGALVTQLVFEGRKFFPLSRRNEFATRLYLAMSDGNQPSIFALGGYSTVRGIPYAAMAGNRAALLNLEWRFPFIDSLNLAFMPLGQVRGRVFLDVGTAWYDTNQGEFNYLGDPGFTFIQDGRLIDGFAAYGVGISLRVFGLPLNWDFVKLWDFKDTIGDTQTIFWIGYRF